MGAIQDLLVGMRRYIGWRALVVALGLLGFELGMRQWSHYGEWIVNNKHDTYGWQMLPSQNAWSRNYDIPIHINKWSYRGPDWDAPLTNEHGEFVKDESVYRVAILGDSMTYGICVPFADIYSQLLEDKLNADFEQRGIDKRAVVMNFAVQGYVFAQSKLVYEQLISNWKPDVLVAPMSPHAIMPFAGGESPIDFPYSDSVLRSASYDYLFKRWIHPTRRTLDLADLKTGPEGEETLVWPVTKKGSSDIAALEADFGQRPYDGEFRKYWLEDIERKRELGAQLKKEGGSFVMLCLPTFYPLVNPKIRTPLEVYQPWAKATQATETKADDVHIIDAYPQAREDMKNLIPEIYAHVAAARKAGRPDGLRHFMHKIKNMDEYLMLVEDQGHFSPRGHQSVAKALFDGLAREGLLPE